MYHYDTKSMSQRFYLWSYPLCNSHSRLLLFPQKTEMDLQRMRAVPPIRLHKPEYIR